MSRFRKTQTILPAIDTHCHLDMIAEAGIPIEETLENASKQNLQGILQIAVDYPSSKNNQEICKKYQSYLSSGLLTYAMGIHPLYVKEGSLEELDKIFELAKASIEDPYFWGIGESGLDYFYCDDQETRELQKVCLEKHLQFASEYKLPIVLHLRETKIYNPQKTQCIKDAWQLVSKYPNLRGVLHCYSYTDKEAMQFVEADWFVSYSGLITYQQTEDVQSGLQKLPLQSLLVETDAPYLTPTAEKPKKNQPAYVQHTLEKLCELRIKGEENSPSFATKSPQSGDDLQKYFCQKILENSKNFLQLRSK